MIQVQPDDLDRVAVEICEVSAVFRRWSRQDFLKAELWAEEEQPSVAPGCLAWTNERLELQSPTVEEDWMKRASAGGGTRSSVLDQLRLKCVSNIQEGELSTQTYMSRICLLQAVQVQKSMYYIYYTDRFKWENLISTDCGKVPDNYPFMIKLLANQE